MINITYLPSLIQPDRFTPLPLNAVIGGIRSGAYSKQVTPARMEYLENGKTAEYKTLKNKIPAVAFAGLFKNSVTNNNLSEATGIFNIDIDGLGIEQAKKCIDDLKSNKHILFAFISPSGDGVKAGIRIGTVKSDFEYKQYFEPVTQLIKPYPNDPAVKDIRRLCFLSFDPDCYYNENAEPFIIDVKEFQDKPKIEYKKPENSADDDVLKALEYLSPNEYHDWIKYGQALKSGGYSFDVFANWSSSYEKFNLEECFKKWDSFQPSLITPATLIHDAKAKGFVKSIAKVDYDSFPDTEVIDTASVPQIPPTKKDNFDWDKINQRIAELNKEFCFVTDGGKSFVIRQSIDEDGIEQLEYLQKNAFLDSFANEFYITGEDSNGNPKKSTIGDLWFKSTDRLQYLRGTTFQPAKTGIPEIYQTLNLWRGFQYLPKKNDSELVKTHVAMYHDLMLNVICGGNREHYDYLLRWIAWGFQYPEKQAGVAVVLNGEKGIGKGTIGKLLLKLWGIYGKQILQAKHLTGNFNSHLARCCFVLADEAFFAGDKSQDGVLKGLITEDFLMVERKNVDARPMKNRLKVMMLSNSEQVVNSSKDERRYFVLEVGSHKKADYDYWKKINGAIANDDALCEFMHELQNIDLSNFVIQIYPETDGNKKQRFKSLSPAGQYFADCLSRGYLYQTDKSVGADTWEGELSSRVSTAYIHAGFIQWCKDQSKSGWDRLTQKEINGYFSKFFSKSVQKNAVVLINGEKTVNMGAATCIEIGELSEALQKFCEYEKLNAADIIPDFVDDEQLDFSNW